MRLTKFVLVFGVATVACAGTLCGKISGNAARVDCEGEYD